jgi:hypothetical protein
MLLKEGSKVIKAIKAKKAKTKVNFEKMNMNMNIREFREMM